MFYEIPKVLHHFNLYRINTTFFLKDWYIKVTEPNKEYNNLFGNRNVIKSGIFFKINFVNC